MAVNLVLFLAGYLVMISLAILHVVPVYYFGGIVVGLFILGLFSFFFYAWHQTSKMVEEESLQAKKTLTGNQNVETEESKKTETSPTIAA